MQSLPPFSNNQPISYAKAYLLYTQKSSRLLRRIGLSFVYVSGGIYLMCHGCLNTCICMRRPSDANSSPDVSFHWMLCSRLWFGIFVLPLKTPSLVGVCLNCDFARKVPLSSSSRACKQRQADSKPFLYKSTSNSLAKTSSQTHSCTVRHVEAIFIRYPCVRACVCVLQSSLPDIWL